MQLEDRPLNNRTVVLGIGGGIAVYRVAEVARLLLKQGATVHVVMTAAAQKFVTRLTFEALTGNTVHQSLFALNNGQTMGHISLIRQADVLLIAPCTANLIAKLAHGIADDLLTTLFAARWHTPTLLAPAMNPSMWLNASTQRNQEVLQHDGITMLGPEQGDTACGESGVGRMVSPNQLLDAVIFACSPKVLAGQHWVINAGPTEEPWDAVRVLSNRASGYLGSVMASELAMMGANVTLVAGSRTPPTNHRVHRIDVCTAEAMLDACITASANVDVFVATAAISDYRFAKQFSRKLKRLDTAEITVSLHANPDIVARIANMPYRPRRVIAFAAESERHCEYARKKLEKKGVDAIIANNVSTMGKGFASGWWLTASACHILPESDKKTFSRRIISCILELDRHA